MASQYPTTIGSVSALPLATALAIIPTLPRPLLNRLVERVVERLDELEPDPDLEPDDFAENDDPREDDNPAEDWRNGAPAQWRIGS